MKKFLLVFTVFLSFQLGAQNSDFYQQLDKMNSLLRLVNDWYVDTPAMESLVEEAIVHLLEELDPHSVYISKEELQKMNEPLEGEFEGVGIQFNILNDTILVVSPIIGGPSYNLGILAGDKIISIDGEVVAGVGFGNNDVQKALRGKKGSKVSVGIKRSGLKNILEFEITRDKIPIYSVDAGYMLDDKVGYIKISRFARKTVEEFREKAKMLEKEGMKALVLDLRGNSGGYLNTAIDLADEFLEKGKLVVYTQGRSFPKDEKFATIRGSYDKAKLVILIDEGSASASEIVTGAIQDWDRGLVVGRRSFGKGLVQKPYMLPDRSAIRLTISRYYTPSGRSIQRPYEKGKDAYYDLLDDRFESGEVFSADSIKLPDSLKYKTSNGRTVYGGGGIVPDIFVPLDTNGRSDYYLNLLRKSHFNNFTLENLDGERKKIEAEYKNVQNFIERYPIEAKVKEFTDYAAAKGLAFDEEGYAESKDKIDNLLLAYLARGVWDISAYYQVINSIDPTVKVALDAIDDKSFKSYLSKP